MVDYDEAAAHDGMRRWLLQHFEPTVLEQLVRQLPDAQPGRCSTIRQIMDGLQPHDYRLFQWLCQGQGPPQPAHLQRVIRQVASAPQKMPLVWLVANPIGRSLLAGGWSGGQTAQLEGETVTLLKPAAAVYHVRYADGGQTYHGVQEAQLFDSRTGPGHSRPYAVGASVWVEHQGARSRAAITAVKSQWKVRHGNGTTSVVQGSQLTASGMHAQWTANHPEQGYAPWAHSIRTRWGQPAWGRQASSTKPLKGVWKEASEEAQRSARLAVLETTRRALAELQRAAKRGAQQGAAEANLAAVQKRVQKGAEAGTFTAEQREKLLQEIREGVQNGVLGDSADTPEFAYEEEAVLPMTVQGLPTEAVRFSGKRCMSRCTDPAACHAQRCTHNDAQPLTTTQGMVLKANKDANLLRDIAPQLCADWVTVAQTEAEGRIQLCPRCHGFLMASLQLRSPNTLLVVR